MGGVVVKAESPSASAPESKLETEIIEAMKRRDVGGSTKSCIGMPNLEATFETIVDAFVFLDKNKDGRVSKNKMVDAINETMPGELSSGGIAMKRFEEMDWDKNGLVNFKEFLFAFTRWVGIEDFEEEEEEEKSYLCRQIR